MFPEQQKNTQFISKRINIIRMIIWGIIGFLLGVFFSFLNTLFSGGKEGWDFFVYLFSGGKEGNLWDREFWSLIILLTLMFGFKGAMSRSKEKSEVQRINEERLSTVEKIIAWSLCIILTPIIAGPIMYYMWKNKYPIKARETNDISLVVFLIELMIFIIVILAR